MQMVMSQKSNADGSIASYIVISQHSSNFAELASGRYTEDGVLVLWHVMNIRAMRSWVSQFSYTETVTYIRVTRNSTFFPMALSGISQS